jgi:hypothetical protein
MNGTPMKYEPGSRVGAIRNANQQTVRLFGYGTYQGMEIPPTEVWPLSEPNPKIQLDSGETVWGCECWWASEDEVKARIGGRTVEMTTVEDYRKEVRERREAIDGLAAAYMLANDGSLSKAMIEESAKTGRPLDFAIMTMEDIHAWREWLEDEVARRKNAATE